MSDEIKYSFGALEDPEDKRDYTLLSATPEAVAGLPVSVDISKQVLIVKMQGDEGTCVANAGSSFKETMDKVQLSVRYLYFRGREISGLPGPGTKGQNEGMVPRDMMKCLQDRGDCKEQTWPYKVWDKGSPTNVMDADAIPYRIKAYSRISTVNDLKSHLANTRTPAVLTIPIYDNAVNWYNENVKANGNTIKVGGTTITSGHGILVVGYDDNKGAFRILNSWSDLWADKGYAWLPYGYTWSDCWTGVDLDGTYDFKWKDKQSPYPTIKAGETTEISFVIKNIGTATWIPGKFNIGIKGDKPSRLYNATWLDVNRPTTVPNEIQPQEEVMITISLTAPLNAKSGEVFRLDLCPVAEGLTWLKDIGIYSLVNIK